MSKFSKTLFILLDLIVLSLVSVPIVLYFSVAQVDWNVTSIEGFYLHNQWAVQYFFWVALAIAILLILGILMILFWPRATKDFSHKVDKGTLNVSQKAIEGFVFSSVAKENFVQSPKVVVHATKRKLAVAVKGQLRRTSNLLDQEEQWTKRLEQQLKQLLGIERNIKVNVKFQSTEKQSEPTSRVE